MLNIPTNLGLNVAGVGHLEICLTRDADLYIIYPSTNARGHISDLEMSMNVSKIMHDCHPLNSPKTASFDF